MSVKQKSLQGQILAKIVRRGRGSVFFGEEFLDMGRTDAAGKALSRLARAGSIRRITTALYHYPEFNDKLGGELPPSADTAAQCRVPGIRTPLRPTNPDPSLAIGTLAYIMSAFFCNSFAVSFVV